MGALNFLNFRFISIECVIDYYMRQFEEWFRGLIWSTPVIILLVMIPFKVIRISRSYYLTFIVNFIPNKVLVIMDLI